MLLKSQPVNLAKDIHKAYVFASVLIFFSSHVVLRIGNHVFTGTINDGFLTNRSVRSISYNNNNISSGLQLPG